MLHWRYGKLQGRGTVWLCNRYTGTHFDLTLSKGPVLPSWSRLDHRQPDVLGNLRVEIWVANVTEGRGVEESGKGEKSKAHSRGEETEQSGEGEGIRAGQDRFSSDRP